MAQIACWECKIFDSKDAGLSGLNKPAKWTRLQAYICGLGVEGWEIVKIDCNDLNINLSFMGSPDDLAHQRKTYDRLHE